MGVMRNCFSNRAEHSLCIKLCALFPELADSMRLFRVKKPCLGSALPSLATLTGLMITSHVPAIAQSGSGLSCPSPRPGRYLAMVQGTAQQEPVALLLQESWNADGSINGIRMERRGRTYREVSYAGKLRPISNCRVAVERGFDNDTVPSQVFIDGAGRPRYGIALLPGVVVSSRWSPQPTTSCKAEVLDGDLVSVREGLNWQENRWVPNTIVQRESWRSGKAMGMGVASFGTTLGESTYQGTMESESTCLATIKKSDSLGNRYSYRGIFRSDGKGYVYLQTDPDALSVGTMERLP